MPAVRESSHFVSAARRPRVRRLVLADYRSYSALDLSVEASVVALTGENGAGKTNVLEALSLFAPGRGLRRAEFAECVRAGTGGFSVSAALAGADGETQLGTGYDLDSAAGPSRKCRIDRVPVGSPRDFADHVRIVWMTPAMDGLFAGSAGERRRFLDRLVLAVDSGHGARVNALERALRNRNRLLETGGEPAWLDAAERETAELGVAVTAARLETVSRLAALVAAERDDASPFPWADFALSGEVEALVAEYAALEAENRYRAWLAANRGRDAAAGRTLIGPQASDLVVRHGPKQIDARACSTGEQKALLTGLVLAHAKLTTAMSGIAPLVLLDEIAAHFDPARRRALFAELARVGGQAWLTGADPAAFADLPEDAKVLRVEAGRIEG
ncbi:MAG: DNA replication/repair protein RecF [Hyphomicrobiales bacterium]|nr:DNA replication/repair protein RecF [Hyphomicrobiales bacterium]